MNALNLPLAFSIVGCVFLFLFAMIAYAKKYTHLNLRQFAMFTGFCIAFNLTLFVEEHCANESSICHVITLVFGSILLIQFVLFSRGLMGISIGESKKQVLLFVISLAPLIIVLSRLLYSQHDGLRYSEIGTICFSGTILFGCVLILFYLCGDRKQLNIKWLRRISFVYGLMTAVLIVLFQLKLTIGILVYLNVLFLMMVFTNILVQENNAIEDSGHKLDDFNLTKRQIEVAHLIMSGLTYSEIADKLSVAENTASKHGSDIFTRTKCQDRNAFFAKFFEEHQKKGGATKSAVN